MDLDGVTYAHLVGAQLGIVHHHGVFQGVLQCGDLAFNLRLFIFCFIVFAVLGKVTVFASLLDRLGNFLTFNGLQILQLVLELQKSFFGNNDLLCHNRVTPL